MQQNFTKEDVILYIYNELESEKRQAIERQIATDPELLIFFQETLVLVNQLDEIQDNPTSTIINILNEESRSNSLEIH
ncbi:MAG: hypothetical protein R2852_06065 [Bacteroidia bacterium]